MERARRVRTPLRASLTRTVNEATAELNAENPSIEVLREKLLKIEDVLEKIKEQDVIILDELLDDDVAENVYAAEQMAIEGYEDGARRIRLQINTKLHELIPPVVPVVEPSSAGGDRGGGDGERRRQFKLPKVELRKFSGDLRDWLSWWGQFQKLDQDDQLHPTDKFAYLIQATVEGSRPRKVIEGYPQTEENYPKAIDALKERFGDKTMLTELYVRQLSRLVILNATQPIKPNSLASLFDELESSLRSLESLGVTTDQSAAFLYPLVESSLPVELVKVWQRSPLSGYDDEDGDEQGVDERLQSLMKFLKKEVKGAERLSFVSSGFEVTEKVKKQRVTPSSDCPTAAGLISTQVSNCLFCDKDHESKECRRASNMSFEEKKSKVMKKRCCFACLLPGHPVKKCSSYVKCIVCNKRHHAVLCPELHQKKTKKPEDSTLSTTMSVTTGGGTILPTLRIKLIGEKGIKVVRALVDTGAQRSYVMSSTADEIGAKFQSQEPLMHSLFGGGLTKRSVHNLYSLEASALDGHETVKLNLLSQDRICIALPPVPRGRWLQDLRQQGIRLSDLGEDNGEVEVLLGSDCIAKLLTGQSRRLTPHLIAMQTTLGWTIMGQMEGKEQSVSSMVIINCVELSELDKLWRLDSIGIMDSISLKSNEEREAAVRLHFEGTVSRREDGRYIVSLPWKEGQDDLPNNRAIALSRLRSATAKLNKEKRYQEYDEIFKAWIKEGIIEEVKDDDSKGHYLPHRPVFKPSSSTTPVRPVFDASCHDKKSPSLNDVLEKGPNDLELIPAIINRFRLRPVGAVADIRKAFQMIEVTPADRNFLKFLWYDEWGGLVTYRHSRVPFGVTSSPFLLAAVIQHLMSRVEDEYRETAELFMKSLYVDNCCVSFNNLEEYENFRHQSVHLLSLAKMELRQWEHTVVEGTGVDLLTGNRCGLVPGNGSSKEDEDATTNILGMKWDKRSDTLVCEVPEGRSDGTTTKREILSFLAKVFDIMGYLSPALLPPKLLLQQSWSLKIGWDQPLPAELVKTFEEWKTQLPIIEKIKLPRNVFGYGGPIASVELHTFCDASSKAYAAAVYIRTVRSNEVSVQLVQSKARVAPTKSATIPRLELLGCYVGAKLGSSVSKDMELQHVRRYFWTDSSTALAWIQRPNQWGTFVANRVKEITEKTDPSEWHHVPGEVNPADVASRGCSFKDLLKTTWWEGPSWLKMSYSDWPCSSLKLDEALVNQEKKKSAVVSIAVIKQPVWYVQRFSNFKSNCRVFAWIKRFVEKLRRRSTTSGDLTPEEIQQSELHMFRLVQQESFGTKEISGLKTKMMDDGTLRVVTKLLQKNDEEFFRFPVVLPNAHPLVEQLIRHYHSIHGHAGVQFLMAKLREKIWIVGGRRAMKKVLSKCVICRRYSSKSTEVEEAALPKERVTTAAAFQVTGVDLAGPLYLKNGSKVWVVLFTCAVYRAVHLELVGSLTTEAFILSLQKFVCRRGRPEVIWSDNGTNFKGSSEAFKRLDWGRIQRNTRTSQIRWRFNPPSAAWWGGWWERLIGTMKGLLRRMLGHSKLTFSQLESMLFEVEGTMNGRPLTYVTEDANDLIPLTPDMFLHHLKSSLLPEVAVVDGNSLRTNFVHLQTLREELRQRFRKEYLGLLVQRRKSKKIEQLQVGDIVLVGADNKKRVMWPMGRVVELVPGSDGHVRVAKVKVKDGFLTRPLQRLYNLEVSPMELPPQPSSNQDEQKKEDSGKAIVTRSGRKIVKPKRFGF